MRISVFAPGGVACISKGCLVQDGHQVLGLDVNLQNLEPVSCDCTFGIEQGLDGLIREAVKHRSLPVTSDRRFMAVTSQ